MPEAKTQQRNGGNGLAGKRKLPQSSVVKELLACEVNDVSAQRTLLRLSRRYGKAPDEIASEIIRDFGEIWGEVQQILRRRDEEVQELLRRRVPSIAGRTAPLPTEAAALKPGGTTAPTDAQYTQAMARFEHELILGFLVQAGGVLRRAERMFGIPISTLRRRIEALGIDVSQYAPTVTHQTSHFNPALALRRQ